MGRATTSADAVARAALLRSALALWRGKPFQGVDLRAAGGPGAATDRAPSGGARGAVAAEVECGRHVAAVGELGALARGYPLRERLHALLMSRCTAAAGRGTRSPSTGRRGSPGRGAGSGARPGATGGGGAHPGGRGGRSAARTRVGEPAQLPGQPRVLVGRGDELAALDRLVGRRGRDAGGDRRWHRRSRQDGPGTSWAGSTGCVSGSPTASSTSTSAATAPRPARDPGTRWPASLGVGPGRRGTIPRTWRSGRPRFRTLVDGRRTLVVLDNAVTADQVRPLLPGGASCFVIVTSRSTLSGLAADVGAHRRARTSGR